MDWARVLAYVTGTVDQELLARNEDLAAENRILKAQLKGRLKLSDAERATLAEIGHRLGRNALTEVATVARPDTILAWYRALVASKFDGSKARRGPGRPRITREVEQLIKAREPHPRSHRHRRQGSLANGGGFTAIVAGGLGLGKVASGLIHRLDAATGPRCAPARPHREWRALSHRPAKSLRQWVGSARSAKQRPRRRLGSHSPSSRR